MATELAITAGRPLPSDAFIISPPVAPKQWRGKLIEVSQQTQMEVVWSEWPGIIVGGMRHKGAGETSAVYGVCMQMASLSSHVFQLHVFYAKTEADK